MELQENDGLNDSTDSGEGSDGVGLFSGRSNHPLLGDGSAGDVGVPSSVSVNWDLIRELQGRGGGSGHQEQLAIQDHSKRSRMPRSSSAESSDGDRGGDRGRAKVRYVQKMEPPPKFKDVCSY